MNSIVDRFFLLSILTSFVFIFTGGSCTKGNENEGIQLVAIMFLLCLSIVASCSLDTVNMHQAVNQDKEASSRATFVWIGFRKKIT